MAAQVRRTEISANGQPPFCWVEFGYDDATMVCNRVAWANETNRPVRVIVTRSNGTVFVDALLAAGDPGGARTLTGGQRFNIETELGMVNLGM